MREVKNKNELYNLLKLSPDSDESKTLSIGITIHNIER